MKLKDKDLGQLVFGCAGISGSSGGYAFGDIEEDKALALLQYAKHKGIKWFDTAPIYGFGSSENRIGKAFKGQREDVFICSKSGVTWHSNKRVDMSNSPETTVKMLEQSLRDLETDYIDLFMIHWPDQNFDIRRALEILQKAKDQQKILHIGLCNTNSEDLEKAKEVTKIEMVQSEFNLFNQVAIDDVFPFLGKEISFQSWGTLDKGILTGSVTKKREEAKNYSIGDCRKNAPWWNQKEVFKKIERMQPVFDYLKEIEVSPLNFAINYNLNFPEISEVLVGMKSEKQVDETLLAIKKPLTKEQLESGVLLLS